MVKIAVMLSGGVDSSVAAGLLLEAGHQVVGVTMLNWGQEPARQAAQVAACLDIPHYIMDIRTIFAERVIKPFCAAYQSGLTPNPCVTCNEEVKFGTLLEEALKLGCEKVATGHYARIMEDQNGLCHLLKGVDSRKDQSYFLYRLTPRQLARVIFPLGSLTKSQVREHAARFGLKTLARAGESQEVCFISGHYGDFLRERMELIPGPIMDTQGQRLGEHRGLPLYTVGQRRGLGIAAGRPVYVVKVDVPANTLYLGGEDELLADGLEAGATVWGCSKPGLPLDVDAKIRYAARPAPATIESCEEGLSRVRFSKPQRAITPGQSVVFYHEDTVLGGGIIARAFRY